MLANISFALFTLKMDIFSRFVEFIPLLLPNATIWSFSPVILFLICCLSSYSRQYTWGCILPDLSILTTNFFQERELQTSRKHLVNAFKSFTEENCPIRQIAFTFSNDRASSRCL